MRDRAMSWVVVATLTGATGCSAQLVDSFDACEIALYVSPPAGAPGDVINVLGGPQSTVYDTLLQIDGTPAEIVDLTRSLDCVGCDSCREETLSCGGCADPCATCVETVSFVTPDISPGVKLLILTNGYGSSTPFEFTVLEATPTDTGAAASSARP